MTHNDSVLESPSLSEAVDRAIAIHGALPVFLRSLRAVLRSGRPPPLQDVDSLPESLRRDVGLGPVHRRPQVF